jgi:hypothetical protein
MSGFRPLLLCGTSTNGRSDISDLLLLAYIVVTNGMLLLAFIVVTSGLTSVAVANSLHSSNRSSDINDLFLLACTIVMGELTSATHSYWPSH